MGPAGLTRLPRLALLLACSGGGLQQFRQGLGWDPTGPPVPPFCIADAIRQHAGGGRVAGMQDAGEAGMTTSIPTPGPPQLQTSASPRSCTHTSSAWASVCLCAEVSRSSARGCWTVGCWGCFSGPSGGRETGDSVCGSAALGVEGLQWDRLPGCQGRLPHLHEAHLHHLGGGSNGFLESTKFPASAGGLGALGLWHWRSRRHYPQLLLGRLLLRDALMAAWCHQSAMVVACAGGCEFGKTNRLLCRAV